MDSEPPVPLTPARPDVEEAKFQLRAAAADVSVTAFVQRHPFTAVALALAAGAVVGGSPSAREIFTKEFVKKLFSML